MQIKKASVGGWMLVVATMLVLAVLSVSAVFAYTSKLSFNMPVSFKIQNCTLSSLGQVVFSSNQEEASSNFAVKPIADNTLEISCNYSSKTFTENAITFSVDEGFTLELTKLVIYDAVAFEKGQTGFENGDYVSQIFEDQTLTITLLSGLNPEGENSDTGYKGDTVVFTIKVT